MSGWGRDRNLRSNCSRQRLINKIGVRCPCRHGGIKRCSAFNLSTSCRHANHDIRLEKKKTSGNFINKILEHCFRYMIIGNYPISHGTAGDKSLGCSTQHPFSILPNSNNFIILSRDCYNRRFIHHQTLTHNPHKRVGGSKIDCNIFAKHN